MSNLYMKQRVFSWGDKFAIYDEYGNEKYFVEGHVFSFGKKLHLYDLAGRELAYIEQQLLTFLPRYMIYRDGEELAEVVKEFTFFHPKYSVNGLGWDVQGDMWSHNYTITQDGTPIVSIHKQWMSWGDAFELDIASGADEVLALAVVLAIDAVMDSQEAANS